MPHINKTERELQELRDALNDPSFCIRCIRKNLERVKLETSVSSEGFELNEDFEAGVFFSCPKCLTVERVEGVPRGTRTLQEIEARWKTISGGGPIDARPV